MAQNITLMGASYSAVPTVLLPKTGGGTARFDDASVTTATASDVASGKTFLASDGTITTGTASGGGGASNIVTGTFKFTPDSATAKNITLNYSGTGYPIACIIVLDDGVLNSTYTTTLARYAIAQYFMTKTYSNQTPTYSTSGDANLGAVASVYKASNTASATLTRNHNTSVNTFSSDNATGTVIACVRFTSKTNMSVYIGEPSGSSRQGFMNGQTYRYWVIYSS